MTDSKISAREGSLEAPTRHIVDWRSPDFTDESALNAELERVFDICHGCRRCFSLCHSFPTLFDAVDESATGELDSVPKEAYWDVVEHCYLCDMCYMTKCPYVPPHEWAVDFPHLMLRAKVKRFDDGKTRFRDRVLTSTDAIGSLAGIPVITQTVNAVNGSKLGRRILQGALGVAADAPLPAYHSKSARRRLGAKIDRRDAPAEPVGRTKGRVVIFTTCYGNRNMPEIVEDLSAVMEHNGIPTALAARERCCGMPKLELGDLKTVEKHKDENIEELCKWVNQGWDIVAPIPSCVLMFKQELPLLFPEDEKVKAVAAAMFDPFEYLMLRHRDGKLKTDFKESLGKVSYQVPCHLRVQNLGLKTRDVLALVPGTEVDAIERCSGHNGTYGVKREYRDTSMKIGKPVFNKVQQAKPDFYASDCPMAGHQIESGLKEPKAPTHPLKLLRLAYGI